MGCWWMLFCELDGRVLGGMQFGVLVDAVLRNCRPGAGGYAVWGVGGGDGRDLERMQFAALAEVVLVQVVWGTARGAGEGAGAFLRD